MRVTIVIAGLGGGGAERVCVNLANAWVAAGREVMLLTFGLRASVYPLDSRVERRDVTPASGVDAETIVDGLRDVNCPELAGEIELLTALRAAVLETWPDVVVSHMDLTNVRVIAALHGTGIPVVACEHTDPSRVSLGAWDRARGSLYKRARTVVASHDATTEWLKVRGVHARTIPNALVPPPSGGQAIPPVPSPPRKRLVTLGRLAPEKRVDLLIRAFARVAEDLPEWDLEVYGDGPLRGELTRVADRLGGRVSMRGFTHTPYDALAGADLYASASCVEGFGNAIWEALACGVPVVAIDCGAPVRTLVRDGVDGRLVRGGEHALSVALAELMGDDGARGRFAERAAEAGQRYALETVLRKWDEVLA